MVLGADVPLEDLEMAPHFLHVVVEDAYAFEVVEVPHVVVVEDEEVLALDDGIVVEARALHLHRVNYDGALEVVLVEEGHDVHVLDVVDLV